MQENISSIILHIPHSGTEFYDDQKEHARTFLDRSKDLIDWYTDELFSPDEENEAVIPVVFPLCRIVCDVERMVDDPLEQSNLGIHYDGHASLKQHGFLGSDNYARTCRYDEYIEHHHKMENLIARHENDLLVIDCHSFSSRPTVLLPDGNLASKSLCHSVSEEKLIPSACCLLAYSSMSSLAISLTER